MAITKEVKVLISAVDQYSGSMMGFNTLAGGVVAAVGAITVAMAAASIKAAEFAVSLGGDILASAADFHDAMFNVEAVAQSFGTTGEDIDGILDRLTTKFPVTGEQAGKALQAIAQLGMGGKEELESMGNAVNVLQIATGADLQTAIQGVAGSMNSFGLETNEADRVINLFAATAFNTAADVGDLTDAMKYAGATASLSGISIEETATVLGLLRNKGLEASQAGTTFRMAIAQLYKETDKGREALKKYGLSYDELNPSVNSISEIIGKFEGKTITAKDAVDIFGVRAQVMAGVINDGKEAFDGMVDSVTDTTAAYDAMEKKAQTWTVVQDQIIGSTDQFKKAIAGGLVPEILRMIGTNENEGLRGVIIYLTDLEKKYGGLNDALSSGFTGMKDVLDDVFTGSLGSVEELYNYLVLLGRGFSENLQIVAKYAGVFAKFGIEGTNSMDMVQFALHAVNTSFAAIGLTIAGIHDVFAIAINAWIFGINAVEKGWAEMKRVAVLVMLEIAKAMNDLPLVDLQDTVDSLTKKYADAEESAKKAFDPEYIEMWSDDVAKAYYETAESIVAMENETNKLAKTSDETKKSIEDMSEAEKQAALGTREYYKQAQEEAAKTAAAQGDLKGTTEAFLSVIESMDSAGGMKTLAEDTKEVDEYTKLVGKNLEVVDGKLVEVGLSSEKAKEETEKLKLETAGIVEGVKDGARSWTDYSIGVEDAKEKTVDLEKSMTEMSDREFSLYSEKFKSDLDLMRQQSEELNKVVLANIEWKAKLDIAEVQANAEVLKAAFESVGQSVESTAEAASSMLSDFAGFEGGMSDKWYMQRVIDDQMDLQREALEMQKGLTKAEVDLLKAKTDRIKDLSDEAMITVNGDGLKPHLEMIMWEIFEQIQIRATQEGLDKLLLGP